MAHNINIKDEYLRMSYNQAYASKQDALENITKKENELYDYKEKLKHATTLEKMDLITTIIENLEYSISVNKTMVSLADDIIENIEKMNEDDR